MKKLLLVIDMQNDFVDGVLGTAEAVSIVPLVRKKLNEYKSLGYPIIFSRDTHDTQYLNTQEGGLLPVVHCVRGTSGHSIVSELNTEGCTVVDKGTFGCINLAERVAELAIDCDSIEICGICTDICVVSNALILKAKLPEMPISVDSKCCAGSSVENHNAALTTMKCCQINVI